MNASLWLPLGSLASIAMLVWLSYALGFRGMQALPADAELIALSDPYGGAREFVIDAKRASAIALLNDGRLLVCKIVGTAIVTRVYANDEIASVADYRPKHEQARGVSLQFKDTGFPSLKLEIPAEHFPHWLERLHSNPRTI